jgi:parvulin-like peptidyl-prolyl isomerase
MDDKPSWWKRLFREPLVHFLLLGTLIFAIAGKLERQRDKADREIVIDNGTAKRLATTYATQMGAMPSQKTLDALIDNYVEDEIYYREAKKAGLQDDDEIIRRRLVQKVKFLESDLTTVPEPTDQILKQFYNTHQELFRDPATTTFTQIYFTPDKAGSEDAKLRAGKVLQKLSDQPHPPTRSPGLGDPFSLQYDYNDMDRLQAKQIFGDFEIVDSLFSVPEKKWSGPFQSGYGWHLIFISQKIQSAIPPYEKVKKEVRRLYEDAYRAKINEEDFDALKKNYIVVRNYNFQ